VDGVLNSVGEGTATLLDEFEHHGGDPDLLRELSLGQSGDPPSVVQGMDFFGDTGWARFHLTKVTGNHYIDKMNDELNLNPTESASPGWQNQQYLTREQVAEILQVTTRTVSEMTSKGIIVAIKLGTGKNSTTRYRKESLDAALKRLEGW
jgi:excisionase family DNA binding protein